MNRIYVLIRMYLYGLNWHRMAKVLQYHILVCHETWPDNKKAHILKQADYKKAHILKHNLLKLKTFIQYSCIGISK